jgi:hypothetical protein
VHVVGEIWLLVLVFPLTVIAAPAYTCAEEQLMLSAMMKIVAFPHTVSYVVQQIELVDTFTVLRPQKPKKQLNNPQDLIRHLCQIYAAVMRRGHI